MMTLRIVPSSFLQGLIKMLRAVNRILFKM